MKFENLHYGQLLKTAVEAAGKDTHWLAKVLNLTERSVRRNYATKEIPIGHISKVSLALGVDLFAECLSDVSRGYYEAGKLAALGPVAEELPKEKQVEFEERLQELRREMDLVLGKLGI